MAKINIGAVIEIRTSKGLSYAHYTHKHPQYGALLRVFGHVHQNRPGDFRDILGGAPTFICFFPLGAALEKGIVSIAGHCALLPDAEKFPVFRVGVPNPATRKVDTWWLWDGSTETRVGTITPAQRKLPIRGVWNDTLLIERIEQGWTPETDLL